MRDFFRIVFYIISYLVMVLVFLLILATCHAPLAAVPIAAIVPAIIIHFDDKHYLERKEKQQLLVDKSTQMAITSTNAIPDVGKRLPSSKKCRQYADELVESAKREIDQSYRERSITTYFARGDTVTNLLKNAIIYEDKAGYDIIERPSLLLKRFEKEFQWKLRDAIEREEEYLLQQIYGPQHNNKRECCQDFLNEIQEFQNRFSEETHDYAMNAYYHLCAAAEIGFQDGLFESEPDDMDLIDMMEGHEFEYYCAGILRKNGFSNVEVTRGSGDQGIDILAEKERIKYGIQCKCYSSDLGNKPIQEAYAGKSIYRCQVAAVMTNRYFTQSGREAAQATGVLLWDRDKLQSMIYKAKTENGYI